MYERRFITSRIELRAGQGDAMSLQGYAAKWNVLSSDLGGFRERLRPNAFRNVLKENQDVRFLRDHNPTAILGRVKNKTLTLAEDSIGLRFNVLLPNTSTARDVYQLVQLRTLSECSFAFSVGEEDWSEECDPENPSERCSVRSIRTIKNCYDCSIVTNPAYPQTEVNSIGPLNLSTQPLDWSGARNLFPEGIPMELRSRVEASNRNSQARAARQRAINFILSL